MGEKLYYLVEILIFLSLGVLCIFKTDYVSKNILKKSSKNSYGMVMFLGVISIANVIRNLLKLLK
jgi:hypothetical protein